MIIFKSSYIFLKLVIVLYFAIYISHNFYRTLNIMLLVFRANQYCQKNCARNTQLSVVRKPRTQYDLNN